MVTFQHDIRTSGDGLYAEAAKVVEVLGMDIRALEFSTDAGMRRFGELRVFFNTDSWDTYEDSLVYTDDGFMQQLRKLLAKNCITEHPSYSELGMQGKITSAWMWMKNSSSNLIELFPLQLFIGIAINKRYRIII